MERWLNIWVTEKRSVRVRWGEQNFVSMRAFSIKGGARVVIRHQSVFAFIIESIKLKSPAMCSLKFVVLFAAIVGCLAEPPRRRFNLKAFARQEVDEPAPNEGYTYQAPAERLRLPLKFRQFARQEETTSSGYSYPKPTDSYGPPGENTEQPSTEYGPPATEAPQETTDSPDDITTNNPQSETLRSLQATQLRRKNAKLTRSRSQPLKKAAQQQLQPVVYVQPQFADFVQPQFVYVF